VHNLRTVNNQDFAYARLRVAVHRELIDPTSSGVSLARERNKGRLVADCTSVIYREDRLRY